MQSITVLNETETLVLGREADDMRALGIISMLSTLAANYGNQTLFSHVDRARIQIESQKYAILYERLDATSPVLQPVGYATWAHLSRAAEVVFGERLRPIQDRDVSSGPNLWVMDFLAPLGHGAEIKKQFELLFPEAATYKATRFRSGSLKVETLHSHLHSPKGDST